MIRRLFADDTLATVDRVAGLLVLRSAQPVAPISRLPVDAVTVTGQQVRLQIAAEQLPLPEPLAELTARLAAQRRNMGTAANPTSSWLFPGRLPGQPITAKQPLSRLRTLGVTRAARTAAFDQLLRDIPAPVLADLVAATPASPPNEPPSWPPTGPPTQHSGPQPMPPVTHSRRNASPTRDATGFGQARSELGSSE